MPRRKKSTKKSSRRRRARVGFIGGGMQPLLLQVAGAVVAGVAKNAVGKALDKQGSMDSKTKELISNVAPAALGFFLAKRSGTVGDLGKGMLIGGAAGLIRNVAGIGAVQVPLIGGMDYRSLPLPAAAGIETVTEKQSVLPRVSNLSDMQIMGGM